MNYLEALWAEAWPNPSLHSATGGESSITGESGVKMTGPYAWEPPTYFYGD